MENIDLQGNIFPPASHLFPHTILGVFLPQPRSCLPHAPRSTAEYNDCYLMGLFPLRHFLLLLQMHRELTLQLLWDILKEDGYFINVVPSTVDFQSVLRDFIRQQCSCDSPAAFMIVSSDRNRNTHWVTTFISYVNRPPTHLKFLINAAHETTQMAPVSLDFKS